MASIRYFYNAELKSTSNTVYRSCAISYKVTYTCTSRMDTWGNFTHSGSAEISSVQFNHDMEVNDNNKQKFSSRRWDLQLGNTWKAYIEKADKKLVRYSAPFTTGSVGTIDRMPRLYKSVSITYGQEDKHIITATKTYGGSGATWNGTTAPQLRFLLYLRSWNPNRYKLSITKGTFTPAPITHNIPLIAIDNKVNTTRMTVQKDYPKEIKLEKINETVNIYFSNNLPWKYFYVPEKNLSNIYRQLDAGLKKDPNEFGHYSPGSDSTTVYSDGSTSDTVHTEEISYSISAPEYRTFGVEFIETPVVGYA